MVSKKDTTLARAIGKQIAFYREKKFPGHGGQGKCIAAFGLDPVKDRGKWSRWERGLAVPLDAEQRKLAKFFGISLAELRGEPAVGTMPFVADAVAPQEYSIPVYGLATCGASGWYSPNPLAIRAQLSVKYKNHDSLFAVIAIGSSMIPEGIKEGYLLFCDPLVSPNPGDAVYVLNTDGTATVKQFVSNDGEWLVLRGWSDPDQAGHQKIYTDKRALRTIAAVSCVVIVQRRA